MGIQRDISIVADFSTSMLFIQLMLSVKRVQSTHFIHQSLAFKGVGAALASLFKVIVPVL